MNYRIHTYDGFINNLKNYINPHAKNHCLFLLNQQDFNEVEILGIESVVKQVCKIYGGLNCKVIISLGSYNRDIDCIYTNSCNKNFRHKEHYNNVSKNISEFENKLLKECPSNIVCIEFNNGIRKNTLLNNILNPKQDNVFTYPLLDDGEY